MTLLELLLSLSIGLFLASLLLKLFSLQETLHQDVNNLSVLNRHALTTRLILTREIESAKVIQILNNNHEFKADNTLFYINKNNLYLKKAQDVAVELIPDVKNLSVALHHSQLEVSVLVYLPENQNETQGVYLTHSIALHFFAKPHCIFNTANQCE
ncbi:MAG: hypothetical protein SFW07_00375 [Gammaproteobacteria bacterium]|nr:hypothetical protein [Gammaproteobacteria bacterium]